MAADTGGATDREEVRDVDPNAGTASTFASEARDALSSVADPLKETALNKAKEQKQAGADQLDVVARAVQGAAEQLESEMPQIASYVRDAGSWLERTSTDIRQKDLEELTTMFTGYAKKQPALVFGGAILAGVALSRFLKSSAPAKSVTRVSRTDVNPAGVGL